MRGKILFVAMHRLDRSPGQRYRFEQYMPDLHADGWQIEVANLLNESDDAIFYKKGHILRKIWIVIRSYFQRWRELLRASDYAIVFVHREALMTGSTFFERGLKKRGCKVIFDFDDAIWLPNVSEGNKFFQFIKGHNKTSRIIALSDLVIAGNEYLASYARQFNSEVEIVPTTIDLEKYTLPHRQENKGPICIGWTGSVTTIQHLKWIEKVLEKIKFKYNKLIYFKIIGTTIYTNDLIKACSINWNSTSEVQDLSSIDIGIMPLPNDSWSEGKCACKGLQYMALSIPTLMSAVGVNREIIQSGSNGLLAENEEAFFVGLSKLIDDEQLRIELGKAGRETVQKSYSRQAWRDRYRALFQKVMLED